MDQSSPKPSPQNELDSEARLLVQVLQALNFDKPAYLEENPDLKIFMEDQLGLATHYLKHGHPEGRQLKFLEPKDHSLFLQQMIASKDLRPGFREVLESVDRLRRLQHEPIAHASNLLNLIGDVPVLVTIEHFEGPKIGDSITALPWILHLAKLFQKPVHLGGLVHPAIKPLVSKLPLRFDSPPSPGPSLMFVAHVQSAFKLAGTQRLHMAQSYFRLAGMAVPPLPMRLDFEVVPTHLLPGYAVHPFTASDDGNHNKMWWPDRWLKVIRYLIGRADAPIYIFGSETDNVSQYLISDKVIPICGRPLEEVLDVIVRSRFFVSLDSGLSHLAHFGGVRRHLIIYPEVVHPTVSVNSHGHFIRGTPASIEPEEVIDLLERLIERDGH